MFEHAVSVPMLRCKLPGSFRIQAPRADRLRLAAAKENDPGVTVHAGLLVFGSQLTHITQIASGILERIRIAFVET